MYKQSKLNKFIVLLFIEIILTVSLYLLYLEYFPIGGSDPVRVYNPPLNLKTKPEYNENIHQSNKQQTAETAKSTEQAVDTSNDHTKLTTKKPSNNVIHTDTGRSVNDSLSHDIQSGTKQRTVKADPRDANLDNLIEIAEQELFKDVDPTLVSSIHIMASEDDIMKYLSKLKSKPNRSKELQHYIDVIERSLEEKKEIETSD